MKKNTLFVFVLLLHTWLYAQDSTKIELSRAKFAVNKLYVPSGLMLAGVLSNSRAGNSPNMMLANWRNEQMPNFRTHVDDYLQYSPIVIAYGLDAFGVESKNDIANRTLILAKGELLVAATTQLMKLSLSNMRPDGSSDNSFPSGHTTQAFAAATFLSEEYKEELPWMPYFAYALASSVGVLRMANNRHYASDVLFGAGLGIVCMKIPYWTHRYRWFKR